MATHRGSGAVVNSPDSEGLGAAVVAGVGWNLYIPLHSSQTA